MLRRNHTTIAYNFQEDRHRRSVPSPIARTFDGFFGPPAGKPRASSSHKSTSPPRKNHTALAPTPCPGVSPEMKKAFDGFFGPPAREEAAMLASTKSNRLSVESLPPYKPHEIQPPLPVYSVLGRY